MTTAQGTAAPRKRAAAGPAKWLSRGAIQLFLLVIGLVWLTPAGERPSPNDGSGRPSQAGPNVSRPRSTPNRASGPSEDRYGIRVRRAVACERGPSRRRK